MFHRKPSWYIDKDQQLDNVNCLEILGVNFNSACNSVDQVNKRTSKCRQAFYGLRDADMAYPGAHASIKKYLWNTICSPTLLYGMECIYMPNNLLAKLETTQGNHIKQCLGLSRTAHSSQLLQALRVTKVKDNLSQQSLRLYHSIFVHETPATELNRFLLSRFISSREIIPGTLIHKVVSSGSSPVSVAFNIPCTYNSSQQVCGITDSLQKLLYHENFIKPYSDEKYLVYLLTKSF